MFLFLVSNEYFNYGTKVILKNLDTFCVVSNPNDAEKIATEQSAYVYRISVEQNDVIEGFNASLHGDKWSAVCTILEKLFGKV